MSVVTMLSCALVGFPEPSHDADPEDARKVADRYYETVKKEIEGFGGTAEVLMGDTVIAAFGTPVEHDDDAERAVRAGLAIIRGVQALNKSESPPASVRVRVGVNSRETAISLGAPFEQADSVVTDDGDIATRLREAAPVNSVVAGRQTFELSRREIEFEELESAAVKGSAQPARIFRVIGPRARLGKETEFDAGSPFIGRERELEILRGIFSRAVEESSAQLVVISGDAGIGKSRLVWEFGEYVEELTDLVTWKHGRCLPNGDRITFWALGEVVKALAGILESDDAATAARKLEESIPESVADPGDLFQRLAPLVGLEGGQASRDENFSAWGTWLEAMAKQWPFVLIVEDIQWADDSMLDFLEYQAERAHAVPLLIVCTARPEFYERRKEWAGEPRRATTISLSPLSTEETSQLASELLGSQGLPDDVRVSMLERAGGNPLYAEEFVRGLQDKSLLHGGAALNEGGNIQVPESLESLIAARFDALPKERKLLLQDAAVIGKVFWSGAVADMRRVSERSLRNEFYDLQRRQIIREARDSSIAGQIEYSFWHAVVRDAAYSKIPRGDLAAKHEEAAAWLEQMAGERVSDVSEVLAEHYTMALDLAVSTGVEGDEGLEAAARRFLVLAGDRAASLGVDKAARLYERALELSHAETDKAEIDLKLSKLRVGYKN